MSSRFPVYSRLTLEAPHAGLPGLWGERKLAMFVCRVVWQGRDGYKRQVAHVAVGREAATIWLHDQVVSLAGSLNLHGWTDPTP